MTTKQSVCDDQGEPLYSYLVLTLPSRDHRNQSASLKKPVQHSDNLFRIWMVKKDSQVTIHMATSKIARPRSKQLKKTAKVGSTWQKKTAR